MSASSLHFPSNSRIRSRFTSWPAIVLRPQSISIARSAQLLPASFGPVRTVTSGSRSSVVSAANGPKCRGEILLRITLPSFRQFTLLGTAEFSYMHGPTCRGQCWAEGRSRVAAERILPDHDWKNLACPTSPPPSAFPHPIRSLPMKGRRTAGTEIDPSACW